MSEVPLGDNALHFGALELSGLWRMRSIIPGLLGFHTLSPAGGTKLRGRLYQEIVDDLEELLHAVGLKAA